MKYKSSNTTVIT